MHVVYDHQAFSLQTHGGISRYFSEIAPRIGAVPGDRCTIVAGAHRSAYLAHLDVPSVGWHVKHVRALTPLRSIVNSAFTRAWLGRHDCDVVHETYYRTSRLSPVRCAVVVTVHDMIHELFPEQFPAHDDTARRKAAAVARADAVICVSENTRADLLAMLPVDPARVHVVHHGCTIPGTPSGAAPATTPFLLHVGPRDGYKNWDTLLEAYAATPSLWQELDVVCFGGRPFTPKEKERIESAGVRPGSVQRVHGDDARLASLYAGASALVYPSLYEGFGLPPLEAMAAGCPVVSSNSSSLPEVVGGAAAMFDPTSPASLATQLVSVVHDPKRQAMLRVAGLARARSLSWEQCARQTRAVYEQAVLARRAQRAR